MFVSYLALVLVGITWTTTDGDLIFTQEPGATLYLQEGSDAVFTWDYKVDKTAELEYIIWRVYNKTEMKTRTLIVEYKNGDVRYSNYSLLVYGTERLRKEGRATLVIKDITFEDSTDYRCILRGQTATAESLVELIVTGRASITPAVIPVYKEEGGSATFTCNATGVPSQYFTWMREGQSMSRVVGKLFGKYEITSASGSSQLTMKNISIDSISDHGYYICDATVNVNQPSSDRGFLGVLSLRQDTDMCPKGDQFATINKTTTICCPVPGFPPPEVTWKLPDGTVKTGNTMLSITPEKEEDFGNCTCSTVNVGTPMGPFVISLKQEISLPALEVSRMQELKPGYKLPWSPVN